MYDKVFISYATEDIAFAQKLYNYLEQRGFVPWLDKNKLLPGQDWNFTIRKALREANYIILLLSGNSVQKRGYVQREFKLALEFFEEKLEDDIYLIPLKINDCEVPVRLSKFQWIACDNHVCFEKILASLQLQRERYLQHEKKQISANNTYSFNEFEDELRYNSSINYYLNTKYIQFTDTNTESIRELNEWILGKKTNSIIRVRNDFFDSSGDLVTLDHGIIDWGYSYYLTPHLISKSVISLTEDFYYFTGGAHGNRSKSVV